MGKCGEGALRPRSDGEGEGEYMNDWGDYFLIYMFGLHVDERNYHD